MLNLEQKNIICGIAFGGQLITAKHITQMEVILRVINERTETLVKTLSRTVGMPVGFNDDDRCFNWIHAQDDVYKALLFVNPWIVLHILTCGFIIVGNGRTLGFW